MSILTAPESTSPASEGYLPRHKVRFVTAASLFDGHDASINIMRRILQATGCEVIHLGHNRAVQDIVDTAIQEDVQGIAVSSYANIIISASIPLSLLAGFAAGTLFAPTPRLMFGEIIFTWHTVPTNAP